MDLELGGGGASGRFSDSRTSIDAALEWDGGGDRCHGEARTARDIAKTRRTACAPANAATPRAPRSFAAAVRVRVVQGAPGQPARPSALRRRRCAGDATEWRSARSIERVLLSTPFYQPPATSWIDFTNSTRPYALSSCHAYTLVLKYACMPESPPRNSAILPSRTRPSDSHIVYASGSRL